MSLDYLFNKNLFNNQFINLFSNMNFSGFNLTTFPMFNFNVNEMVSYFNYSPVDTNIWDKAKVDTNKKNYSTLDGITKKSQYSSLNSSIANYDENAGKKLAETALDNSKGFKGRCAAYVKTAIQKANLGSYQSGHAFQMDEILRKNSNFQEISSENVDLKSLPAGCVLVYDKGVSGYSKNYGHTEITTGDGRAVSDGITNNLYKKPSSIFVPVLA